MNTRETSHAVEIILDSYRVTGDIVAAGGPRRLVDILNAHDDSFVLVRDAEIDDPMTDGDTPSIHDIVQVHLNSILFAIPVGEHVRHEDPFETVQKVPVESTVVLPGYEVIGRIHLIADVIPGETPLLGAKHFVAFTNARIISLYNRARMWKADVVCVNLARAVLFAPHSVVPTAA